MKNKKFIVIASVSIIIIIFLCIFYILNYKKAKMGNNIADKTLQEIEGYILNISSYKAKIELTVESNKNTNKYVIEQKFTKPNMCMQIVEEPKNIEGLTIKYDGTNLEVSNSKLNLTTIYENYQYITDNVIWLSDFIENYKSKGGKIIEKDGIIIMETRCNINAYSVVEKLYIDRNANKITKMIIEDQNHKARIYITYKEIDIDGLNQDNVFAFKYKEINSTEI